MNTYLKQEIIKGNCILLLGAGASFNSLDSRKRPILMGEELSKELCAEIGITHQPGQLPKVYEIAKRKLGAKLVNFLEDKFSGTTPSNELNRIARYVWQRIYTLNIDDATEIAFQRNSNQTVKTLNRTDPWKEIDQQLARLDIIKLNGCINRPTDGFIFSPLEYSATANNPPEWYKQLGRDYLNYTFIFIGTKIDEPLFYQQLEYYKSCWEGSPGTPGQAFVITPDIDEISQEFFHSINLTHIKGTLKTLIEWIDSEVKPSTTPSEVAAIKHPELIFIDLANKKTEQDLSKIHKVSGLNKLKSEKHSGKTREFYLGFKPSWDDIFDDVPAELSFYRTFQKSLENDNKLNILIGPAGSGKSTALMKAAAYLSSTGNSVYYLKEPISSLASIISELDKANTGNYYFFIDKITTVIDGLISSLEKNSHTKAIFVCGERVNVWKQRAESVLSRFSPSVTRVSSLDERDAKLILEKLEAYGPWTRIAKLSPSQRIEELIDRSKKQLLIGLLELTTGYGFHKIIEDDFKKLDSNDTRTFVVIIGLATAHNISITKDMCISALKNAEISRHINDLLLATHGIVTQSDNLLRARHPVYVDKLFNGLVELSLKDKAIRALLMTMTRNKKPISKNMSRTEVMLFKYTINYNHLHNFFHGKKEYVLRIFEDFEKHFELDGLFYLQYGLSLRSFGMNSEALNKLQTAIASWTMKQTEHAYAHQLLICALEQQSSEIAYRNLEEAKPILMRLDSQHHEEDTDYPLVTLGEYHVKIEKKFGTIDNAKRIASHYLNELKNRQIRGRNNYRIEEAKREILKTITKPQKNKKIRTSQQPPVTRSS